MEESNIESSENTKLILSEKNISLILDSYDDLFSDFDPRPYSARGLSDDFLTECRKAVRGKKPESQALELRLLVPKYKRKITKENMIKKRIKEFFMNQAKEKQRDLNLIRKEGVKWFFIGACLSLTSSFLLYQKGMLSNIILVITEPGGWFSLWTGLDKLFIEPKSKKPELEFYNSMAKMSIKFYSY
ncbi:MAG: hypothetical protein GYA51_12260 [Candidatus Methanofastidiosa archaeon]|jgi:hypothetical protein|nr:hypothetical protein [Candidatus Methanofastidiosa archaeon]